MTGSSSSKELVSSHVWELEILFPARNAFTKVSPKDSQSSYESLTRFYGGARSWTEREHVLYAYFFSKETRMHRRVSGSRSQSRIIHDIATWLRWEAEWCSLEVASWLEMGSQHLIAAEDADITGKYYRVPLVEKWGSVSRGHESVRVVPKSGSQSSRDTCVDTAETDLIRASWIGGGRVACFDGKCTAVMT